MKTDETALRNSVHHRGGVEAMCELLKLNRAGEQKGIYAVCSANPLVLQAAIAQAVHDQSPLLIEATCNQVNHEGGYTGMTPTGFREYVYSIAKEMNYPLDRLILGGDHLGPNPWRSNPSAIAMEKACAMVSAFVSAGFSKIHLDTSMRCSDDPDVLADEVIAERAATLCLVAETAASPSQSKPVYIVGTEVPTPGGAQEAIEMEVTTAASLRGTLRVHRAAFERAGLLSAWHRVIGVVVQPGVEFGDETIVDYVPENAVDIIESIALQEGIVFEAHSTDYQTGAALGQLVQGHFGILKVGPELTFVMREAIFGLARIEEEWIPKERCSNIRATIDRVMVENPENWKAYYHGNDNEVQIARAYSLSDRIRYYWPNPEIDSALALVRKNLRECPAPLPLVGQYLPLQAEAIRQHEIENDPDAIIMHRIRRSLSRYAVACRLARHDSCSAIL